ncbi:histone-lysine N-methyltransferase EHMT1-like [Notechis scutatus]|uniref:Histone-lysine N-methyltransferase EHMT1-like n=1 Tax=Notechis scutatus TaxID=8663 RepID=A0A6J1V6Z2_9SAUR|nr:histone-lysine N-methyltransferase EHMT1-like [Notechis scutatus]
MPLAEPHFSGPQNTGTRDWWSCCCPMGQTQISVTNLFLACGAVSLRNQAGQLPQQCTQLSSSSCRALQAFSAQLPSQVEQVLSRDISRGFEQVAIPCLNMVDQESCPGDFLYITGNIVSGSALLPTKKWDQSQCTQFTFT